MTGGWIQAGLLSSLDGRAGLAAWRWLFIIVSIITIPIVILGELYLCVIIRLAANKDNRMGRDS
jgi:ACS family pantothenate transporter-like MFS transporter